ncbi:MAG: hypothetical protein RMJ56_00610 [Gemmataceae bacterium]|nr:hypothetical protein [Gemmata sp.]MDW8196081.1 hypothetical protein [Gemmataceae bacterium]
MKSRPWGLTVHGLGIIVILTSVVIIPALNADERRPQAHKPQLLIPGGGTELFRALLDKAGIKPVTLQDIRTRPWAEDDLIVITLGNPQHQVFNAEPLIWARLTIEANGAALIASDDRFSVYSAVQPGGFNPVTNFTGIPVRAHHRDCFQGDEDCPWVVPYSPAQWPQPIDNPGPVWGLFRGLNKLATNQPTYLEEPQQYRGEYQYPLARLPRSARTDWAARFIPPPLFAIGGDGPQQANGRPGYAFLAVADASLYINQMLMERETDNLELALRTIEYLQGPQKHRKRCLFFENGRVMENFDGLKQALARPPQKVPPQAMPDLGTFLSKNQEKLVDLGEELIDRLESQDALQKLLLGPEGSERQARRFARWMEWLAATAAIMIAVFLLGRTFSSRHPLDAPPAPSTGAGAAPTGPPGVFERRQRELLANNNLYEPVHQLMRDFFISAGARPDPEGRPPSVEIAATVRKPDSLRCAIRDMWRIAFGPPIAISPQRWHELEPYFRRLRQAHADGLWRFLPTTQAT